MLITYTSLFDLDFLSETSCDNLAVLEEYAEALNEGVFDNRVITMGKTYTYSMVIEFLDNVKEKLLKLCSTVLSYLNNYILNSAKLIDKYREILKDRLKDLDEPFTFSYYKYPKEKDYPSIIPSNGWVESEVRKLQSTIKKDGWTTERVENAINKLLEEFADRTVHGPIDPYNIKDTTASIIYRKLRGDIDIRILTADELDKMIDEFKTYKPYIDEIKRTKSSVEKDYTALKKAYSNAVKIDPETKDITNLQMIYDPDLATFKANEQVRFGDINIQMTRLFTGFIDIYNTAFTTKLNIIRERVDINRHVIQELIQRTGIFAALNTKNPDRYKKPYKYEPNIET